jgi:organic hydroperoxide reductase OsmC/OhrA
MSFGRLPYWLNLHENIFTMQVATKVQHTFSVALEWDNDSHAGIVHSGKRNPIVVASPPEFGGTDKLWSPEHLMAAALVSCYTTTFFYFAKLLKVNVESFSVNVEMEIEKEDKGPFTATRFIVQPRIKFEEKPEQSVIDNLLEKTKKYCIITNSVKGAEVVIPLIES